ncbi:Cytochrome c oxidase subunit III [Ruegeria sp. THAF57]|nr:Cytochrome c oxidase subunit III [Ruegeria sp. THAF57]
MLNYSSRTDLRAQVEAGADHRAVSFAPFQNTDVATLALDPTLRDRFEPLIAPLYRDNCAACHGRSAEGRDGFPSLTDDHWLWSGAPEEIETTIRYGINARHDETRFAQMPAFGRDDLLEGTHLTDVAEFVLKISGQDHDLPSAERGAQVFLENCAGCHAEDGAGGYENGAPSLTDRNWIYGGDRAALLGTLESGRAGVMPAWSGRLSPAEIRQLTLYLIWAGQTGDHD